MGAETSLNQDLNVNVQTELPHANQGGLLCFLFWLPAAACCCSFLLSQHIQLS